MNKKALIDRLEFLENMEWRIKTDIEYSKTNVQSIHSTPYDENDLIENQKELKEVRDSLSKL